MKPPSAPCALSARSASTKARRWPPSRWSPVTTARPTLRTTCAAVLTLVTTPAARAVWASAKARASRALRCAHGVPYLRLPRRVGLLSPPLAYPLLTGAILLALHHPRPLALLQLKRVGVLALRGKLAPADPAHGGIFRGPACASGRVPTLQATISAAISSNARLSREIVCAALSPS